jgi:hypothetical protein
MPGFHLTPSAEGIAPVLVELGGDPLRAGKGEEKKQEESVFPGHAGQKIGAVG